MATLKSHEIDTVWAPIITTTEGWGRRGGGLMMVIDDDGSRTTEHGKSHGAISRSLIIYWLWMYVCTPPPPLSYLDYNKLSK